MASADSGAGREQSGRTRSSNPEGLLATGLHRESGLEVLLGRAYYAA